MKHKMPNSKTVDNDKLLFTRLYCLQ